MKNMSVLYSIAIIAIVVILVYCVSYTSGTAPMDNVPTIGKCSEVKQALKNKSCACYDEKQIRIEN